MVEAQREEVRSLFWAHIEMAKQAVHRFDKYAALISGEAEEEVDDLLRGKPSSQEMMLEVVRLWQLTVEIKYSPTQVGLAPEQLLDPEWLRLSLTGLCFMCCRGTSTA